MWWREDLPDSGRLEDHWTWRPEWTPDRPRLLWYLTFEDRPQVGAAVAEAGERLRAGNADVIPARWLHLTLCDIGFADEVDPREAERAARRVAEALRSHPPIPMTLGPIGTMSDAVVLAAGPVEPLCRLRDLVHEATFDGSLEPPVGDEFWPHVSLCYLNDSSDGEVVREVVSTPRPDLEDVRCDRLTQALVSRSHGHYHWERLAQVPLAHARARSLSSRS